MDTRQDTVDVERLEPIGRAEGIELGREAYLRFIEAARALGPDDWSKPTDCTEWTVRDMVGHVTGMMWSMAKLRRTAAEQAKSMARARKNGTDPTDEMTAIQVERMKGLDTEQLVATAEGLVDEIVAGRRRIPDAMADRMKLSVLVEGEPEPWTLSYLTGIILTRDTWLHRVADLARAVDRAPRLDAEHDGRLVADVVAEWARRHGQPFSLTLTGPAGGRFRSGEGGPSIELDAIEFCRMLSGRATPTHPLLETPVPF